MAFISSATTVLSFAEYNDVYIRDMRLFEANEGLTEDGVEDHLIRGTERILSLLNADLGITVDIDLILARQNDFTDLCVYFAMHEYILPQFADVGNDEDSEFNKIAYYQSKFDRLYGELVEDGDWYDTDNDGTVEDGESLATNIQERRVR